MSDSKYFTTTDPEGREIHLAKKTWDRHISTGHPEIRGVREVKSTVERPNVIIKNEERQTLAYSKVTTTKMYVNVFAKMDDTYQSGRVATSFITKDLPKGDVAWLAKK